MMPGAEIMALHFSSIQKKKRNGMKWNYNAWAENILPSISIMKFQFPLPLLPNCLLQKPEIVMEGGSVDLMEEERYSQLLLVC